MLIILITFRYNEVLAQVHYALPVYVSKDHEDSDADWTSTTLDLVVVNFKEDAL